MEEKIIITDCKNIKDICFGCDDTQCDYGKDKRIQCFLKSEPDYEIEQSPNNIEDVKRILDESKIKHELFYVNDKDYRWTINDKVKILRAIVIRFKTKFDDVYTEYSVTIDNDNRIVIHKYKYEGSESITMKLSTMEQIWNMFANIYKDVLGEE